MKKAVFGLSLFAAVSLYADYTMQMRISGDGENMIQRFKYKDAQHAKVESFVKGQKVSETLGVGKKTYFITYHNGKVVRVTDADEMKKMMAAYGGNELQSDPVAKGKVTWRNTGKRKKVGSLEGEVWVAETTDASGREETMEFVLTKQKLYRDAMQAYAEFSSRLAMTEGEKKEFEDFGSVKPGYAVLQMKDSFFVESVKSGSIDAEEFVLPKQDGGSASKQTVPDAQDQQPEEEDEGAKTREGINKGVDDAVEMFKSLF